MVVNLLNFHTPGLGFSKDKLLTTKYAILWIVLCSVDVIVHPLNNFDVVTHPA